LRLGACDASAMDDWRFRYQYQFFHLDGCHFVFVLGGTATSRLCASLPRPFVKDGASSL
jgi:hypothetical protein